MGTVDSVGNAAQPGLLWEGLLRKNRASPTSAHYQAAAATQRSCPPGQCEPRTATARMDRSSSAGLSDRRSFRVGSGTTVSNSHANLQTENQLLSLPRLGWISPRSEEHTSELQSLRHL